MNDIDTMIEVLQAVKTGKEVQYLYSNKWFKADTSEPAGLNFLGYKFRVKPEPKVIWVNEYKNQGVYSTDFFGYRSVEQAEAVAEQLIHGSPLLRTAVKYVEVIE